MRDSTSSSLINATRKCMVVYGCVIIKDQQCDSVLNHPANLHSGPQGNSTMKSSRIWEYMYVLCTDAGNNTNDKRGHGLEREQGG